MLNFVYSVEVNGRHYLYQSDEYLSPTVEQVQKQVYLRLYGRAPKETGDNNPPLWGIAVSPLGARDLVEVSVIIEEEVNVNVALHPVK